MGSPGTVSTGASNSHTLDALERSADLTWPGLADKLDAWIDGNEFDRKTKADIRSDIRKGFRAWLRQTVGSVPLARAWVKYGLSTRESVQGVLRELLKSQKKNEDKGPKTRNSHPELARQAHEARNKWRHGQYLANRRVHEGRNYYWSLDAEAREVLDAYDSRDLEASMIRLNIKFGHGRGAPMGMSLEELAVIEYKLAGHKRRLRFVVAEILRSCI